MTVIVPWLPVGTLRSIIITVIIHCLSVDTFRSKIMTTTNKTVIIHCLPVTTFRSIIIKVIVHCLPVTTFRSIIITVIIHFFRGHFEIYNHYSNRTLFIRGHFQIYNHHNHKQKIQRSSECVAPPLKFNGQASVWLLPFNNTGRMLVLFLTISAWTFFQS